MFTIHRFHRTCAVLGAAGFLTLGLAGQAAAEGSSDTADANVTLQVWQAISVTNDAGMDFGTVFTGDGSAVNAETPASFSVTGQDGEAYTITIPNTVDLNDGDTNTVTVNLSADASGTLTGGSDSFTVAGEIPAGSVPGTAGTYTGTFTAMVEYTN